MIEHDENLSGLELPVYRRLPLGKRSFFGAVVGAVAGDKLFDQPVKRAGAQRFGCTTGLSVTVRCDLLVGWHKSATNQVFPTFQPMS